MNSALSLGLVALLLARIPAQAKEPSSASPKPEVETCDALASKLFETAPTRFTGQVKEPKRLSFVKPDYPDVPAGTVGSGVWLGEALIAPDGTVCAVSVLRDLKFTPPFPPFSKAISDAILKWRYAPTSVDGKAVPVCMTISVNIHWR